MANSAVGSDRNSPQKKFWERSWKVISSGESDEMTVSAPSTCSIVAFSSSDAVSFSAFSCADYSVIGYPPAMWRK